VILRPYQHRTLYEALLPWFEAHEDGNPIVSACVGSGKSIMIAEFCRLAARGYTEYRSRVLVLVPSKELLEQNYAELVRITPDLRMGLVSASAGRKDVAFDKDVVVATVGSVIKNPGNLGRLDLIMVDECHLISRKDEGQYRQLIRECQKYNPDLRVIGWTGTPYRGNGVWLTAGEDRLFTDIAARVSMSELLSAGYLAPLVPGVTRIQVDASDVGTANGDYIVAELAKKLDQAELTEKIADEIVEHGQDRKRWLVFGVTVEHAEHLQSALKARGVTAGLVTGKTPKVERERTIAAFRAGRFRCLVNVCVLTTGFNVPDVDLLALVRNTKSPVLYTQIAGRGMRCAGANMEESIRNGKANCLWLDFTDTTLTLGPVDQIKGRGESKPREDAGGTPFKTCPDCGANNATGVPACVQCGFTFAVPEHKMHAQANGADVLSGTHYGYKEISVGRVTYQSHQKSGTDNFILRVNYWAGMKPVCSEWICLEHKGFAREKAVRWWRERYAGTLDLPVPSSVVEALDMVEWLRVPDKIVVKYGEKYPDFIRAVFEEREAA
jgi:DNA repair protein RadD